MQTQIALKARENRVKALATLAARKSGVVSLDAARARVKPVFVSSRVTSEVYKDDTITSFPIAA